MRAFHFLAALLFVGSSACVKIPETGESALILTSVGQENRMGADGYREVLAQAEISNDPRRNAILKRVGARIARVANRPDFDWQFTLIESKEQNAWCMPGGKIAVYTGILPAMKNEAGMAVVVAHEVAHATLRHAGRRITEQMILGLGLSVVDLSLSDKKHRGTLMALLGAGTTVGVILPYSRRDEYQADAVGVEYMAKAGYDPREAVRFWRRFTAGAGGAPPEFLSTHPGGPNRIRDLNRQMPTYLRLYESAPARSGVGESLL